MAAPEIASPYLPFLGDTKDPISAKTARGVAFWRPDLCLGEIKMPEATVSLDLPELSLEEAVCLGARSLVIGVVNSGGVISESWVPLLAKALEVGLDIVSGLHNKVSDIPQLAALAEKHDRKIHDVRHPTQRLTTGKGYPRRGKRLLTVGTDCAVGKMYTTLALEKAAREAGWNADFVATGQTGILIAGKGISIDAVVSDFISGAVELLSPDAADDHWDMIEGQGSLFHPSYAGVSLGLLHGAQPDCLVLCHEFDRPHMRGIPDRDLPPLDICLERNLEAAQLTNPGVRFVGVAVNSSILDEEEARRRCDNIAECFDLPCVDPVRHGVTPILDRMAL